MLQVIILSIIAFTLGNVGFRLIPPLLVKAQAVAPNFRGESIPVGYGLLFALNLVIILISGTLLGYYSFNQTIFLITLILVMAFVGLLDDVFGNKINQGFSGHFKVLLFKRELTTGAIKAIFSFMIIFFINFYWNKLWFDLLVNTFLILLMTNFINLVDLRPGRALKVVLFFSILALTFSLKNRLLILPLIITVISALNFDLKAQGMMGDIGSNVLGVILGGVLAISYDFNTRLIILILLVLIHLYSEFYSITELIKRNKLLLYLDKLGR